MVAMDLTRFAAVISVPAAFALGRLSFAQLVVVSVVVAAADITFRAAGGACLKALVRPEDLLAANARFESTTWTATVLGPPLGGPRIALFGPVTTVVADAVSYLLSAAGIRAIGGKEPRPARTGAPRLRAATCSKVAVHPDPLGPAPAVLQHRPGQRPDPGYLAAARRPHLGRLAFAPWQYGLAFGAPCLGGLIGSRLARRLAARFGPARVMRTAGSLRACWSLRAASSGPAWPDSCS